MQWSSCPLQLRRAQEVHMKSEESKKPVGAAKALDDAFKHAVHESANDPIAPPRVRESMKQLERDLKKKQ